MYEIIEDCSPYCIRFRFEGLEELINFIKTLKPSVEYGAVNYFHRTFHEVDAKKIIEKLPMANDFDWLTKRFTIFSTPPGRCCAIHKDGNAYKDGGGGDFVGINIPLTILDDQCVTSWYDDEVFKDMNVFGWPYCFKVLFDPKGYDQFPKLKQMVMKPTEVVLFNSSIYHSWENNKSKNIREILTLRFKHGEQINFFDARKILFGY